MATSRASDARAAVDLTFEELYRGHRADVYRAALRELGNVHDAEDVTQAAFVDAYRAVLRGTQPQSPRAWLLAISENVRRRRFRTAQRRPREELVDADFPLAAEVPYEQAGALAEALAALPREQSRVFVLRELAGLSYDEIADEVGATVPAIQMLLFRARRSLRAELDPPVVGRRQAGLIVPMPGWLTGLLSRSEVTWLTPRAAGAVGAAVVAVVGASVAVTNAPADGKSSPAARSQLRPTLAARPTAGAPGVSRPTVSVQPRTVGRVQHASRPVPRSSVDAPPAADATAPAPTPIVAPTGVIPALERLRLPVPLPAEKVRSLLEPPVPPPSSTDPLLGAGAGAMGAAGAGAPPLPVPSLPLETLPPAP